MKFYMPFKPIKLRFKIHCIIDYETNYIFNLFFEPSKQLNKIVAFDNSYNHIQNIFYFFIKELKTNNHYVFLIVGIVIYNYFEYNNI